MKSFKVIKVQEFQNNVFATDERGYVWVGQPGGDFRLFELHTGDVDAELMKHMLGTDNV